jgi:tetratricopeptide (TPR) repeat protein
MVNIRTQPGIAFWKHAAFCAFALALSAVPLGAQRGGGSGASRGSTGAAPSGNSGVPTYQPGVQPNTQTNMDPDAPMTTTQPLPKAVIVEDETCLPWNLSDVRGATVSAIRLGVPSKARNEYNKACDAFKKKELPAAEQHVRGAIQDYSNYVAAWVMLGQVLQDEQKMAEAHDACSQALSVDPTYLPPYLCMADLLDRQSQWDDLVALSDRFSGLNLVGDRYAYYYRAEAFFHTSKLSEAQKNASKALAIDDEHHLPDLYFLLAQIYGKQGDVVDAAAQVREFLKFSNNRLEKDAAKQYLSELQSQQTAK